MDLKSIVNKVFGNTEHKSSRNLFIGSNLDTSTPYTDHKAITLYNNVDIVYKAIDLISSNFACVEYSVNSINADGTYNKLPNHPLQKLIDHPNGIQSKTQFNYSMCAWRLINGNSFAWIVTSDNDVIEQPIAMFAMPSTTFQLIDISENWYYQYSHLPGFKGPRDTKFNLDYITGESNVLHWNTFSTDSMVNGTSPLQAVNTNADIYKNANEWNSKYFDNGCRPSLVFVGESKPDEEAMTTEDINEFQKLLETRFSGRDNNNRPLVTEGFKPHEISTNAKDADFIESLKQQEKAIARSFGIPPILLNAGEGSTFNNQSEAQQTLWVETMFKIVKSYVEELNNTLAKRYGDDIVIVPDYSEIDALQQRNLKNYEIAKMADHLTVNEKRQLTGQDVIDGGDTLFIPSNLLPIDIAADGLGILEADTEE